MIKKLKCFFGFHTPYVMTNLGTWDMKKQTWASPKACFYYKCCDKHKWVNREKWMPKRLIK